MAGKVFSNRDGPTHCFSYLKPPLGCCHNRESPPVGKAYSKFFRSASHCHSFHDFIPRSAHTPASPLNPRLKTPVLPFFSHGDPSIPCTRTAVRRPRAARGIHATAASNHCDRHLPPLTCSRKRSFFYAWAVGEVTLLRPLRDNSPSQRRDSQMVTACDKWALSVPPQPISMAVQRVSQTPARPFY